MSVAAPTTGHEGGHAHPSDRNYVGIAAILAVITAAEVGMSYADVSQAVFIPVLMVMMVAKFAIVAAWFMHLKFDNKLYRRLFIAGIVLAVGVYLAFLTAMQLWGDDTTSEHRALGAPAPLVR